MGEAVRCATTHSILMCATMAKRRIFIPIRTLPIFLAAVSLSCDRSKEPILFGLAGPVSQQRGRSMQLGAELAVSEINQAGGLLGQRVELVVHDDSGRDDTAARVARSLYDDDRVVAVIGHLSSNTTAAAAPIYNGGSKPIVSVSPSASAPGIGKLGSYTFRIAADDMLHGTRLAERAHDLIGNQPAGIIFRDDPTGRSVAASFRSTFERLGGKVVAEDPYSESLPTLEPYLARMQKRGGVRALILARIGGGVLNVIAALDTVGTHPVLFGTDELLGPLFADSIENFFISTAYLPSHPRRPNRAFVGSYTRVYGKSMPTESAAAAYDIVKLLAHAIEAAGTNRTDIRDFLSRVGTRIRPFEGVTGRIAFNSEGDAFGKNVTIGIVRDGQLTTVPVP